jgi:hypothetical protein
LKQSLEGEWISAPTWANQTRLIKRKDSTYKFFWSANDKGQGGVGILLAEKWFDKVLDVQRVYQIGIAYRSDSFWEG